MMAPASASSSWETSVGSRFTTPSPQGAARASTDPLRQSGQQERAEAVMLEPARIGGEEIAQIRHAVFQHGETIDAHAEGVALVFLRIDAAITQHVRMHHAAAENFEPIIARADADLPAGT